MRFRANVAILGCLVLVAACGGSARQSLSASATSVPSTGPTSSGHPTGAVTVTLGIYSGRPDPDWQLTGDQVEALETLLVALPESRGVPPVGGLGYHGFTILIGGSTLVAYRGFVAPPGDVPRNVVADPTGSIERYLLETARPYLTADEQAEVGRALAGP